MTTEFWLGMTTLPIATGLVALTLITVSRIPAEPFGKCRRGHRIELLRDSEDPKHDDVIGTTWECVECQRAWRVVSTVTASSSHPVRRNHREGEQTMTTTDPFTEVARAEAEIRYPKPTTDTRTLIYPTAALRKHSREAFVAGAEWARSDLTAQEPTDAEVEAAARTWVESGPTTAVWEQMTEERRGYTRERMHACLSAARAARGGMT